MIGLRIALAALVLAAAAPTIAQAPGETSAVRVPACDHACLIARLDGFMAALAAGDAARLPLAANVRYSENDVLLPLDAGLWATVTAVDKVGLEAADPLTGNAAWFGSVRENGHPAIYAVRIHVADGRIDEIEAVVHRKTALPAPFGNVEAMAHAPEFGELLPPGERRPRERMLALADGYFDTVELNDGQVFTHFAEDCGRLENGILTTAPRPGEQPSAAQLARGCENQFKLGLYRINKRIRRDEFIVDEERGVVVARGFFDHANEFDHYQLTDGREMKTALKWPNSITLLEAFRIRNGEIQRIEAVFTYVPYFMHNPFWGPASHPPAYPPQPDKCAAACLEQGARTAISAMVGNRWQQVNWAPQVGYAENSVGLRVGEGIWATVSAVDPAPLVVADPLTGKAVWIGRIEEHGQPAWGAMTVTMAGGQVGGIEALIRRKEYGAPYVEPAAAPQFATLPQAQRTSRATMVQIFATLVAAVNAHAPPPDLLAPGCHYVVDGAAVGDCAVAIASVGKGERDRDTALLAADETRGIAVFRSYQDAPALDGEGYPRTYQAVEVLRFESGKLAGIQAFTAELPFGMPPHD